MKCSNNVKKANIMRWKKEKLWRQSRAKLKRMKTLQANTFYLTIGLFEPVHNYGNGESKNKYTGKSTESPDDFSWSSKSNQLHLYEKYNLKNQVLELKMVQSTCPGRFLDCSHIQPWWVSSSPTYLCTENLIFLETSNMAKHWGRFVLIRQGTSPQYQ